MVIKYLYHENYGHLSGSDTLVVRLRVSLTPPEIAIQIQGYILQSVYIPAEMVLNRMFGCNNWWHFV